MIAALWRTLPVTLALAFALAACGERGPDRAGADAHDEHSHGRGSHDDAGPHADAPRTVTIAPDIARASGLDTETAGPGVIRDQHEVQGALIPVEGRHANVVARFPGPVVRVAAGVGERVARGATLAVVESNASLASYAVTSPLSGVVMARHVAAGDFAGSTPLFEIADLSTLWVDLHVFGADAGHLAAGQRVAVTRLADGKTVETAIDRILPSTATESQSTVARATLDNTDGGWRPGAAVSARVTVSEAEVAIALPIDALQTLDGRVVAFVRDGHTYAPRLLTLGRRDAARVEVLAGIAAGDTVVVAQSFLVKADLEKSAAGHAH